MISEFSESDLRGVDMSETLRLYHSKDDRFKGLIYDQTYQLVVQNFPVPEEYTFPQQRAAFELAYANEPFPLTVYEAIEGTVIRVYYHQEEWHLSTSSRLDAFASTWASDQSFGHQFEEWVETVSGVPLDIFLCSLRRDRKYFFLLPTVGINRLGKSPREETHMHRIYLVAIETDTHELLFGPRLPRDETNLWSYAREWSVASIEEWMTLAEQFNLMYYRSATQLVKCMTESYTERCALRNNQINILHRYLELYQAEEHDRCDALRNMYPEMDFETLLFDKMDRAIRVIHQAYMNRYVHRQVVHLPKTIYVMIRKCHNRYRETREKTTYTTIRAILLEQQPRHILLLLNDLEQT